MDVDFGGLVDLATLRPNDTVHVRTGNSDYRLRVVDPHQGRVIVQGGSALTAPVESDVFAMAGQCGVRRGRIAVGLGLEILSGKGWVRTSRVRSIRVEREGALPIGRPSAGG